MYVCMYVWCLILLFACVYFGWEGAVYKRNTSQICLFYFAGFSHLLLLFCFLYFCVEKNNYNGTLFIKHSSIQ
uniref:Uncharacterized protein n=1 Tax=Octopus bimaculoides TaxID=37653 RepID=A0A0L8FFQ4_OCTBM